MRDDGIGIRVASELRRHPLDGNVFVYAYRDLDLSLIEKVEGAAVVVLVDALQSGKPPGTVSTYEIGRGSKSVPVELPSLHGLGLAELFGLARQAGLLDGPVTVVGVEPGDCSQGRRMSKEVASAVPKVLEAVASSLHRSSVVLKGRQSVQTIGRSKPKPTEESG
jgi:hydrogenase maturation protease